MKHATPLKVGKPEVIEDELDSKVAGGNPNVALFDRRAQALACSMGEHEEGSQIGPDVKDGQIPMVPVCKHCRCLYVEA